MSVPEPTPRKAIGISILAVLVDCGIRFILDCCRLGLAADSRAGQVQLSLLAAPLCLLAMAVLTSQLLPTTPRRAILVTLLQAAMEIVVVVVLTALYLTIHVCDRL